MQMNRAKRRSKLNLIMLLRYNINSSLFLLNIKIQLVVFFNLKEKNKNKKEINKCLSVVCYVIMR